MKLGAFEIGDGCACQHREGDAISCRPWWIGRHCPQMTSTSRRQHGDGRGYIEAPNVLARPNGGTCAATILYMQVGHGGVVDNGQVGSTFELGDERAFDLCTGGVSAGMQDSSTTVGALVSEYVSVTVPVKLRALVGEPPYGFPSTLDQHSGGVDIDKPGSRANRVGKMEFAAVIVADRSRETALSVSRVAFAQCGFRHDEHADGFRQR
jgi:hypothetical protein